jgi:hypothetical protein
MLSKSWDKIDDALLEFKQGEREDLSSDTQQFLSRLGFIDDTGHLSDLGEQYYDSRFIFENGDDELILRDQLLSLEEVRELCQAFYGQETTRQKVELFLKSKTDMDDDTAVGRLLLLLNDVNIVDYSKRTGSVKFTTEDLVEAEGQESYRITTRTPYSNIKRLRRCIRQCSGTVCWVDKHFSKKGLEPLSDEIAADDVSSIKILCGTSNVHTGLRDDFKRFAEEMERRDVDAQLRVLLSSEIFHEIHDRWILSDTVSWNVPPINSLYQNQEAEIHQTDEDIPFDRWWESGKDIIDEWNPIYAEIQD